MDTVDRILTWTGGCSASTQMRLCVAGFSVRRLHGRFSAFTRSKIVTRTLPGRRRRVYGCSNYDVACSARRAPTMSEPVPLVSVIVPTHNRVSLLRLTLRSVLWQEGIDLEVLVVDDGSTDD